MLAGFYADFGNFVAKTGTVVVAEDMGGQVRGAHLLLDAGPQLDIGALGHDVLPGSTEQPGLAEAPAVFLQEGEYV